MEGLRAVCPELPMHCKALGSAPTLHMPISVSCLYISVQPGNRAVLLFHLLSPSLPFSVGREPSLAPSFLPSLRFKDVPSLP